MRADDGELEARVEGPGVVHTGSISSTVDLDFAHGEAHKVYHPSFPVRLLYRLAFQAPFPYVASHPALEAARLRRRIVDILTKYWFGHHLVARVIDVEDVAGGAHDFVTQLVRGHEPADKQRAKAFLKELDRLFMDAGIATWQITPYNPHSITNLIEKDDGTYRIIDLESSLVAFLYPLSRLPGFLRAGLVPSFDDVDVDRLEGYLEVQGGDMAAVLGREFAELERLVTRYREAQDAWHASEPRLINRTLRFLFRLVDVPSWVRGARRLFARGEKAAVDHLHQGLDQWVTEGKISREQAEAMLASLSAPDVERAVLHLSAHFAISLPLRFPFGASARFLYTVFLRLKAETLGLLRRGDVREARRLHPAPVALFSLLPGVGRVAYMFSPALSHQPLFAAVPCDIACRKLPFRLYERLHLEALFLYWGLGSPGAPAAKHSLRRLPAAIVARHYALRPHWALIATVLAVNGLVFAIGLGLYLEAGQPETFWWFDEFGVTQSLEAAQLLVAAYCGVRAYQLYWQRPRTERSVAEDYGIFLWAIGGIGLLVFAIDDFTGIHEFLGRKLMSLGLVPDFITMPDDILVIGYAIGGVAVLVIFRHEVFRARNSTALLIPAAAASLVMVVTDVLAQTRTGEALEFPAQTLAVACLTLAFVIRYREIKECATPVRS
jgi:hypothetical protein